MYLFDDRFSTVVAFVVGFDTAQDGKPLRGFQEWVCERFIGGHSGQHWAFVIASSRVPSSGGYLSIDRIPQELDSGLVVELVDLLEEFSERHSEIGP
ncbi:hypothetical protein JIX56_17940 [Streptomyces sp. CA-210063]|uniref:hypothetical protein n=1 Tax=Streptomyces sp. CA-210063 TaxID=2801029 RepID=UPI00214BA393|nr:hypothetical protein [Streptomyces sp. CA-210063]UUU31640.1 hypothetical protein JIX56_17940 [Streptomyces sp. CA-210063]